MGEPGVHNYNVRVGTVDLLFVVDNSVSMANDHAKMATAIQGNFLQSIGVSNVDYRIGVITMDIQTSSNPPRPYSNWNGALQSGKLIPFSDGSKFITPSSYAGNLQVASRELAAVVTRPETINCEKHGQTDACPSSDERGILAAMYTVRRGDFFRRNSHKTIIFLTDEDVRSTGLANVYYRKLVDNDYPVALITELASKFPGNTFNFYSVIIPHGDQSCLNQQGSEDYSSPSYGFLYHIMQNPYQTVRSPSYESSLTFKLASNDLMLQGGVGSICASNYGATLGNITNFMRNPLNKISLRCRINEETLRVSTNKSISWSLIDYNKTLYFESPGLNPGDRLNLAYTCAR